jgi:Ni,Fe-hydrogenase I cytochrome b subunit
MDRIDAMLSESSTEPLSLSVKHALLFARKIMDKYYSKTDLSNIYQIAMGIFFVVGVLFSINYCLVLHPQMKLKYFQQHKWPKAWIDTAKEIVREEFAKYRKPRATDAAAVRLTIYFVAGQSPH